MCAPAVPLIALAAVSAASAAQQGAQYAAQSQDANAAAKFQNKRYSQTGSIAMDNYFRTISTTQTRLQQEQASAGQAALQNHAAGTQSQATALTAAANAGVQGNSVALLFNDFAQQEASNNYSIYQNMQWERQQADEELKSAHANTYGNIASATPQRVRGPSSLALGIGLAGTALQGFDNYQKATNRGVYNRNNTSRI